MRGDFAAFVGLPGRIEMHTPDMSPKEIRQIIKSASFRQGPPFVLLSHILGEGESGNTLVDKELVPEIVDAVKNGNLNLDVLDDDVICSAFASIISRKVTGLTTITKRQSTSSKKHRVYLDILMGSIEKTISPSQHPDGNAKESHNHDVGRNPLRPYYLEILPISRRWCTELKVFLKLHSVSFE